MITVEVGALSLARTRWALSPAADLLGLLRKGPLGGRRTASRFWRPEVDSDPLVTLVADLAHPVGGGYQPDFLTPKPAARLSPGDVFQAQLAEVAATPPDLVDQQVRLRYRGRRPSRLRPLIESGQLAPLLAQGMARAWRLVGESSWESVVGSLREELDARAAQTSRLGLLATLGSLAPELTVDGVQLQIRLGDWSENTVLSSDELVLVPRAFGLDGVSTQLCTPSQALLYYPVVTEGRPRGTADASAALIGSTRLSILSELQAPATTGQLSNRLGFASATVSYHLRILHANGLVSRRRRGRDVLYQRTARGSLLGSRPGLADGRPARVRGEVSPGMDV